MPVALVCWDLDGTLVDSVVGISTAVNAVRERHGAAPLSVSAVGGLIGNGVAALLSRALMPLAVTTEDHDQFDNVYAQVCDQHSVCFPEMLAVVKHLAQLGIEQGVVTNKPDAYVPRILAAVGLTPYISTWVGGDGPRKPDPRPVQTVMTRLGHPPHLTWMIGDHHTDIIAGHSAGCRTLLCLWGYGSPGQHTPTAIAHHPRDIMPCLGIDG